MATGGTDGYVRLWDAASGKATGKPLGFGPRHEIAWLNSSNQQGKHTRLWVGCSAQSL